MQLDKYLLRYGLSLTGVQTLVSIGVTVTVAGSDGAHGHSDQGNSSKGVSHCERRVEVCRDVGSVDDPCAAPDQDCSGGVCERALLFVV